jgi:nitrate/nitrite transporter NarK
VFNVLGVGHHHRSHSPISAANAATWFGDHERTSATTICTVAGFVGPALGEMLPPMFVTQANHGRDAWMLLIIVHGVHTVV